MGLKNSQYDAIFRKYNQIQFKNKHILDTRIEEVYNKNDEFQSIDSEIAALSVSQGIKLINGDSSALASLKEQIKKLSDRRIELLNYMGYPYNYLDPVYTCPDCKDTGYVNNKKCHCLNKLIIDMLYSSSNLGERLSVENFDHFSFDYYSENIVDEATGLTSLALAKRAYNEAKDFVESFDSDFKNLFFYGRAGVGKTFISNCIAKELMDTSHSVIYFSAPQLFDVLAKSNFEHDLEAGEAEEHIFNCDLLIIDDLGTELTNMFVSSQLFSCINERILRKRSTIISTNILLSKLSDTYSERTFSRISSNYTMLKLAGDDIRLIKKYNR